MTQASEGISFVDVGRTFLTREGTTLTALDSTLRRAGFAAPADAGVAAALAVYAEEAR